MHWLCSKRDHRVRFFSFWSAACEHTHVHTHMATTLDTIHWRTLLPAQALPRLYHCVLGKYTLSPKKWRFGPDVDSFNVFRAAFVRAGGTGTGAWCNVCLGQRLRHRVGRQPGVSAVHLRRRMLHNLARTPALEGLTHSASAPYPISCVPPAALSRANTRRHTVHKELSTRN